MLRTLEQDSDIVPFPKNQTQKRSQRGIFRDTGSETEGFKPKGVSLRDVTAIKTQPAARSKRHDASEVGGISKSVADPTSQ